MLALCLCGRVSLTARWFAAVANVYSKVMHVH